MRSGECRMLGAALAALGLLCLTPWATSGRGDEPGRFGRLFRFGGSPSPAATTHPPDDTPADLAPTTTFRGVPGPAPAPAAGPSLTMPGAPQPRLIPQPRVSRPVTDADPIVTRVSLGRSDDGTQFGMFLQVYADGTVIDSEGVHHAGRDAIKEVVRALEQGDLSRIKGHCGGPSTDFIEHVQMVVFERSLGRLRANVFSFSGNLQGCDHAVRHLQNTLDALQAKLTRPAQSTPARSDSAQGVPSLAPSSAPIQLNGGLAPLEQ